MTRKEPRSRLDVGAFTAAEIQTMARFAEVPVEAARRLVECAIQIGKLPRAEASRPPVSGDSKYEQINGVTYQRLPNGKLTLAAATPPERSGLRHTEGQGEVCAPGCPVWDAADAEWNRTHDARLSSGGEDTP